MSETGDDQSAQIPADASAEELAARATAQPELWEAIAAHPNAYDDLRSWIADQQAGSAQGAAEGEASRSHEAVSPGWPMPPSSPASTPASAPPVPAAASSQGPVAFAETQASGAPAKKSGLVVTAMIAVGALIVLGGTGGALALTGTWPFGEDGVFAGSSTAEAEQVAQQDVVTFDDGYQVLWERPEDDDALEPLYGFLPEGTASPINDRLFPAPVVQFSGGTIVTRFSVDGGTRDLIEVFDLGGKVIDSFEVDDFSYCKASASTQVAVCIDGPNEELRVFDEGGVRTNFPVQLARSDEWRSIEVTDDRVYMWTMNALVAFDLDGESLWQQELSGTGVSVQDHQGSVLVEDDEEFVVYGSDGDEVSRVTGIEGPTCGGFLATTAVVLVGEGCSDAKITGSLELNVAATPESATLRRAGVEQQIGLIEMWNGEQFDTTAVSLENGEVIWDISGFRSFETSAPSVLDVGGEDEYVLMSAGASSEKPALFQLKDGTQRDLESLTADRMPVVSGDRIIEFGAASDDLTARMRVIDPENDKETFAEDVPVPGEKFVAFGGSNGIALGGYSDGDYAYDAMTFLAPGAAKSEAGEASAVPALDNVPDFIPSCPGDTVLLAWAEMNEGWLVICGYTVDEPVYVAVQYPGESRKAYSDGATDVDSSAAEASIEWDGEKQKYYITMASEERVTLDYVLGTLTRRDSTDTTTLEQYRLVRYVVVPISTNVRTLTETAGEEGTYGVETPEDTADDQVRYMIQVLEKAYEGRALVKDAMPKMTTCAGGVGSAGSFGTTISQMKQIRDNRAELLEALRSMPVDKIPQGQELLDELRTGIWESHRANVEFVAWAEAANANGCPTTLSAKGQAAMVASDAPKERFASLWNRVVAPKFGVRTFDGWYI